ncbi:MAG: regulatory protein [Bacteroidetes bacterium ADurb.Bin217]|nr:MAG: regulatory protein [Bacteroidetes bacterium ADurb.Bin217]
MDPKFLLIIQDSIDIYRKYGIKSVSMEDLCKELKISKKTIYKYIKNKDELLAHIFIHFLNAEFENRLEQIKKLEGNAIDFILQITEHYFFENNAITTAMVNDIYMHYPLIFKQFNALGIQRKQEIIEYNIEQGQREGMYKNDIQKTIISLIFSNFDIFKKIPEQSDFTENDVFKEIIRIYIYSVATPKGITYYEKSVSRR